MTNDTDDMPAGWYTDASEVNCLRYWNGADWTEQTAPARIGTEAIELPGMVAAVRIGFGFALIAPPLGFLIGCFSIGKAEEAPGIIGLSVIASVVWAIIALN